MNYDAVREFRDKEVNQWRELVLFVRGKTQDKDK